MSGFQWSILILLHSVVTHAFKYGAPPYICKNPFPTHGAFVAQTTPSPFVLSAQVFDEENGIVHLRIHSSTNSSSDYFMGYFVRIKNIASFLEKSIGTGTFRLEHTEGMVFQCQDEATSAVTHDTNLKKRELKIKWQAPPGFTGEVVFTSTIVVNFTHFWMQVESYPVAVSRKPSADERTISESVLPLNETLVMMHKNCSISKNCLYTPENCIVNYSCDALLTIKPFNGAYEVEIFSKDAIYVAMGISNDFNMGADAITECVSEISDVKAYRSWNVPRRKTNKRLFDQDGIRLLRGLYENNIIYCKMHLDPVFVIDGYTFDLNKNWYYVTLASGTELLEGKPGIGYHDRYRVSPNGRYYLPAITVDPDDEFFYKDCRNDTVCHGVPGTCVATKNCNLACKVRVQDHKFIVSLLTRKTMYVAVGFTEDQRRGNDHIVECLNNRTEVQAWRSWNIPDVFDNLRMGQSGLELLDGKLLKRNGLECTVAFDPSVIPSFKLDLQYYFILAGGSSLMPNKVGYHNKARSINAATVGLYANSPQDVRDKLFYIGCGESRTCIGHPEGCISTKSCDYAVSIAPDNVRDIHSFHIIGNKSPGYVAVGLSADKIMGDDLVVECVNLKNGSAKAFLSYNEPNGKTNQRITKKSYFMPTYGSFIDEKLECIALIEHPHFTIGNKSFDLLKDKYFLMLAVGKLDSDVSSNASENLRYHDVLCSVSSQAQTLRVFEAIGQRSRIPVYFHAISMIISWIAFSGFGIIVARYYKTSEKDVKPLPCHWFTMHKYSMGLTAALTIIGVVVMYFYCGQIILTGPASNHSLLGFATTILVLVQPLVALLRPASRSTRRIIFNTFHWFVGNVSYIIAICTIFLSVDLPKAHLPQLTYWVLIAYIFHYVLIYSLLKILGDVRTYKSEKENEIKSKEKLLSGSQRSDEYPVDTTYSKFKNLIFKYNLAVTLLIVFFLIILVLNE